MLGFLLFQRRKLGPFAVAEAVFPLDRVTAALPVDRGQSIAGVCGSLDSLLALLKGGPRRAVAFAADARQAALAELKAAAFRRLEREETLGFLGYDAMPEAKRAALYARLEPDLSADARALFGRRPEIVAHGVLEYGLFRQWVALVAEHLRTQIASPLDCEVLLGTRPATRAERVQLFRARVRGSRVVRYAIEPLLRVFPGLVDRHFFEPASPLDASVVRQLTREAFDLVERLVADGLSTNPALQRHLGGRMPGHLERELYSPEAYEQVKRHIARLEIVPLNIVSGLRRERADSFDRLFLGNLADFLAPDWQGWLRNEIERCSRTGARFLSYSLLPRDRFQRARSPRLQLDDRLSLALSNQDPTGLFPVVGVYRIGGASAPAPLRARPSA
jgi:S-adenosylmethionine:diacylglycerol 3-amino-3-carboxypropyl transferase